jgi:hypothetical protein
MREGLERWCHECGTRVRGQSKEERGKKKEAKRSFIAGRVGETNQDVKELHRSEAVKLEDSFGRFEALGRFA